MALRHIICIILVASMGFSGQGLAKESVRIGLRAHLGVELAMQQWQPTADYLSEIIPEYHFQMVPFVSLAELNAAAAKGSFDFVLTNPSAYVELELTAGASRILTLRNKVFGAPVTRFGSVFITRADRDDISELADLSGKHLMAVSERAFGGWHVAWGELMDHGIDPLSQLGQLSWGDGLQSNVVAAVEQGRVDAGVIRTNMLERMAARGEIRLEDFKLINIKRNTTFPLLHSTKLYPEWPLAKLPHTDRYLADRVAIALLSLGAQHAAAVAGGYHGWTVPLSYQPVHDLLKRLRVGPYEHHGEITFGDLLQNYGKWLAALLLLLLAALFTILHIVNINQRLSLARQELQAARDNLEQRVRQRTFELEEEIKARQRTENALIAARDEAQHANRAKSEFLSSMSHELRTPLNAVLGFAQVLQSDKERPLDMEQQDLVNEISLAGDHLLALINDILDLSRIEAGQLNLHWQSIHSADVVDHVVQLVQAMAAEKRIRLETINPATATLITTDPTRLRQILLNLLSNAIKYGHAGGTVILESKFEGNQIRFSVSDDGPGIADSQLPYLFEPFNRLGQEHKGVDGTGIGLVVTRSLTEMLGGDIQVQTEVGRGSTFTVRLPVDGNLQALA